MIRETLDASAPETFSYFITAGSSLYEYMTSRAFEDSTAVQTNGATVTAPYWVRVVRNANQFSAYVSANGATWTQIGTTQTITTAQTVYVGLGVSSSSTSILATATLDNVSIGSGSSLPNPIIAGLSPSSGAPGKSVTISGSSFGATQNGGSVSFNSAAATVTSWSDAQIVVVVPDNVTTGPVSVTVGGITYQGPTFTVSLSVQLTDSLGNQTSYVSAPMGGEWVLTTSQGSGCSTCTTRGNIQNVYDGNGNLIGTTDPLGNTTLYASDSSGNLTTQASVLNSTAVTTKYTYNSFGEVLTMTDPLGNVTTNTYDSHGNLLTVTTPKPNSNTAASVTQFAYNSLGELTQITDPLGRITKMTYTTAAYIASITDPQNNVTSYGYDSRGNRTSVTDALNKQTTFAYDSGNRLTGITYPDSSTASFTYDSRGRRITATDQNGKTTTYAYDDADRLTSVTDAASNVAQYAYDTENNLLSITDANTNTTNFAYDAFGRVTKTTFPSGNIETYAYDADNNLTSKADRKNQTIQYVYDALNRLTQKTYPDSTTAAYTYDLVSKILQVNDPTGTYAFAYDNMGRLIGSTTTYSFPPNTPFTNSYSYDADSNRTGFTAPDGSTNTYTYDTLNRLTTLANSWAGSFGFSYDALSRRTQMTRPNNITTNYTYDTLSRLLSVLHQAGTSTIDGATYTVDAAGNRTAKTDNLAGVTSNYTYDRIYELTQVMQGTSTTESYSYDAVGNRLSSLGVSPYSYNTSNELTSTPSASYTYDYNGNTLTKVVGSNTTSYAWDFENRLTQVTLPGTGGTATFKYDPFGRRIQKVFTQNSTTTTTNYLYDGDNTVEETNQNGAVVAKYARTANIDELLAESVGGATYDHEQDGLGSATSLTNSSGALALTYTYDSFGKITASSGSVTNPFRYTGRDFDSETGLYFYRARYYDSSSGRFISEDQTGFGAGPNFYLYAANDPIALNDPLGNDPGTTVLPRLIENTWDWTLKGWGAAAGVVTVALDWTLFAPSVERDEDRLRRPTCRTRRENCEIQWENDNSVCRILPDAAARARCYESANQRLGNCLAGRPEGPLVTW
jgi:RHS repeat-associated protein